ncbi:WD40-repeat-containing domain protein [Catenaria anguillulae PL171]|uniref:WD40-repeat-containing domain protein n=1 Tax=Catenaria anguillulae PL171 TaxID=765915 RepID=A0A1Y2HGK2_9FUNG|nr:WD40-repeat-containing domain protein [Catenaria anguillulae PL171]
MPHTTILRSRSLGATHPTRALSHHWHTSQLERLAPSRLYPLRLFHKAACRCLALEHVDDRYLLTSGVDAAIALWDTRPQVDDVSVRGAGGRIRPVASIGSYVEYHCLVITLFPRETSAIGLTLDSGQAIRDVSHSSCVTSLAWYPNDTGMFLTGSLDHSIRVWDTNHLEEAALFDLGSEIHALSVSSSALIAAAAQEPNVRLCDLRSAASVQALRGHTGEVRSVAWFPEHEYMIASGSTDGTLRIWDTRQSRSQLAIMQAGDPSRAGTSQAMLGTPTGIAVAPDGAYAVLMLGTSGRTQMATTRTHHSLPYSSPPALLHTSTHHTSAPGYFVPSNQDVLFLDLFESSTSSSSRRPLAFAPLTSPRPGRLIGASHARTRKVGTGLATVNSLVYSAKRMSLVSADEAGGVVVWDTSAATANAVAAAAAAASGKRRRGSRADGFDDPEEDDQVVVRYAWEVAGQGEQSDVTTTSVKRARMDEWSDDED